MTRVFWAKKSGKTKHAFQDIEIYDEIYDFARKGSGKHNGIYKALIVVLLVQTNRLVFLVQTD